jgi:hypothetical protein
MNNPIQRLATIVSNVSKTITTSSDPLDIQLGIWGTTGAGKTTYLGRLYTELLSTHKWIVDASPESFKYINDIVEALENGNFPQNTPETTSEIPGYEYRLTGKTPPFKGVNVTLCFIDAPGLFYEKPEKGKAKVKLNGQKVLIDVLDYLSGCHGIIFLLDPDPKRLPQQKKLSIVLLELMQEFQKRYQAQFQDKKARQLQQYMAFCVTKADKGDLWNELHDPKNVAKRIMGDTVYNGLQNTFCLPKRFEFYPVSSIGRYQEGKDGSWKQAVNYPQQNDPDPTNNQSNEVSEPQKPLSDMWEEMTNEKPYEFESQEKPTNQEPESSFTDSSNDNNYGLSPSSPNEPPRPSEENPTFDVEKNPVPINILEPIEWLIQGIRANPPSLPNQTTIQAEQPPLPPFSR